MKLRQEIESDASIGVSKGKISLVATP